MSEFVHTSKAIEARAFKRYPKRGRRKIKGSSIAILVFLTMCALFVSVPLYVIIITSFKSMDQIALGEMFSWPTSWSFDAWWTAWQDVCSGMSCKGVQAGFVTSMKILIPSLIFSVGISAVTGYALALWNIKWAGTFLFVLFMAAFVPFQISMINP